jgi:hypothetical protein
MAGTVVFLIEAAVVAAIRLLLRVLARRRS